MSTTRAPAERNLSRNCLQVHFAPLKRDRAFLAPFYKHFVTTGREAGLHELLGISIRPLRGLNQQLLFEQTRSNQQTK